ncbi:alpha-(1,3)-fucosyltransferase C-like [Saccostrea echinata]|uniref:alpha-(1,3)-fucosyltransferase C-like n=1 Tax=Saccostrea echinata TaxID=191078 RepID=UPI002A82F0DA|nr:alpha-(1,3)-fucosyltransferase C-like [Saccostrea echinata]
MVMILYFLLFYENYIDSIPIHNMKFYDYKHSYVTTFSNMTLSNHKQKTIAVWTTFFRYMSWLDSINFVLSKCRYKCRATGREGIAQSDAVLFHYQRHDLHVKDLPKKRNPNQIWIIYLLEPTTYIERNIVELNGLFNWTMSHRRDSTVFAPYGSFIERPSPNDIRPLSNRKKFAFAVFSRCNDNGKRYRIVRELQKYINIDIFGSCGSLKCDTKSQQCLSTERAQDYLFRLSFENSHCKDYVTEKLWFPLKQGVIPVVNWAKEQKETRVNSSHVINIYDFSNIKDLANYLKSVATNETLYNSYFSWRKTLDVETSHFHAFCKLCKKLHQPQILRQVYSDLDGWVSSDICPKYKYVQHIVGWIDRWILFPVGL